MFSDLEQVRRSCRVSDLESRLLQSPGSPIVLLSKRNPDAEDQAAPGNPNLGALLPYTPLHHLLLAEIGAPVIATSGNRSEEPICTTNEEALERLTGIADGFLVHNRPIARHVDDSIAWVVAGRRQILRRARGYAPLPLVTKTPLPSILAVGGHLKNSIALSRGNLIVPSQHIGDLDTYETEAAFEKVIGDLGSLYQIEATITAHDKHPDYGSTTYAIDRSTGADRVPVQHHLAHVYACMAENELDGPVLGISWDGTGYGNDGTIWGGEWFAVDRDASQRKFTLLPFRLPGSEAAVREPRRSALGLLWQYKQGGASITEDFEYLSSFSGAELGILEQSLRNGINAPFSSSMGRLFDAVAAILNLCLVNQYEGEAAMKLEHAAMASQDRDFYTINLEPGDGDRPGTFDWHPMIGDILEDLRSGVDRCDIARRFHNTLSQVILATAQQVDIDAVVLTGGCFQNRLLTETAIEQLRRNGFRPYWHQRIPPNDGGIAVGQIIGAARVLTRDR
jgi:hydrogenase maturation protein HypF